MGLLAEPDIRVVNSLGRAHAEATANDPRASFQTAHDAARTYQQTAALCAQRGLMYVPMVCAAQGGLGRRAEAVLHQLASQVARAEGSEDATA